ncbi:MAG: hypothetical protein PVI23_08010 [Maricaulaceae bacterium]|jgi:hypothetical protein
MSKLPTDLKLLDAIYTKYYDDFCAFTDENKNRSTKIWVPIDIETLAKRFGTDPDMIFGRLYYHLRGKYRQPMGDEVLEFFQMRIGGDRHCVNFPFLASVLADLREERRRFVVATRIAALSLVISLVSIVVAVAY